MARMMKINDAAAAAFVVAVAVAVAVALSRPPILDLDAYTPVHVVYTDEA